MLHTFFFHQLNYLYNEQFSKHSSVEPHRFSTYRNTFKFYYPELAFIRGVEHTLSLFFNDVSKIPIVHQIISAHKMIYNIFGSGIYHNPHSIFKSKSQEFQNRNIGLFRGNQTRMAGYFMGMHIDLRMQIFFNILHHLQNSLVFLPITNLTKQLCLFMIIGCGKGAMYFSRLFLPL